MKIMGGNVIESTLIDKVTYKTLSTDSQHVISEEENNVPTWQIHDNSIVGKVFQSENPYEGRQVGVTKKTQERKQ